VRSTTVFFEPAKIGDFGLGHDGELRINVELPLCVLQAFESVILWPESATPRSGISVFLTRHMQFIESALLLAAFATLPT
jgi:hypothetical protein